MIKFHKNETKITIETRLREFSLRNMLHSVESCRADDLVNYGRVVSSEVSSRYSGRVSKEKEESRTSVSVDRIRDCRKFRTIEETKLDEREITVTALYRMSSCFTAGKGEPAGRLPRVLLPLKLIRSIYVYRLL